MDAKKSTTLESTYDTRKKTKNLNLILIIFSLSETSEPSEIREASVLSESSEPSKLSEPSALSESSESSDPSESTAVQQQRATEQDNFRLANVMNRK